MARYKITRSIENGKETNMTSGTYTIFEAKAQLQRIKESAIKRGYEILEELGSTDRKLSAIRYGQNYCFRIVEVRK